MHMTDHVKQVNQEIIKLDDSSVTHPGQQSGRNDFEILLFIAIRNSNSNTKQLLLHLFEKATCNIIEVIPKILNLK